MSKDASSTSQSIPQSREQIEVEGFTVEVVRKAIRRLYLRVLPPDGRVCVTAPRRASEEWICRMVSLKKEWIERHQLRLRLRPQDPQGSIRFLGQLYLLNRVEHEKLAISLREGFLDLYVPAQTSAESHEEIIQEWYRRELKALIPPLFSKWEPILGVRASSWGIKKMKTLWGSCNVQTGRILLNLELVKKPFPCLEYVVVHELVHLLEPSHNHRFKAFMDRFLPSWRKLRDELKGKQCLERGNQK